MPSFTNPAADADEVQQALRGLAHATRRFAEPGDVYNVLGSLSQALGSLSQTLHQLGAFHDGTASRLARVDGNAREGRATSYQISWDLHRAGEMLRHIEEMVSRAHESEATIAYDVSSLPRLRVVAPAAASTVNPRPQGPGSGVSL